MLWGKFHSLSVHVKHQFEGGSVTSIELNAEDPDQMLVNTKDGMSFPATRRLHMLAKLRARNACTAHSDIVRL